jgi:hypothetical protein
VGGRWFFRVIVFVWECVVEMAAVSHRTDDAKVLENYGMFQRGIGMTGSSVGTRAGYPPEEFLLLKRRNPQHEFRIAGSTGAGFDTALATCFSARCLSILRSSAACFRPNRLRNLKRWNASFPGSTYGPIEKCTMRTTSLPLTSGTYDTARAQVRHVRHYSPRSGNPNCSRSFGVSSRKTQHSYA